MDSQTGDSLACFWDCFDSEGIQSLYIDDGSAVCGGGQHLLVDGYSSSPDGNGSSYDSSPAAAVATATSTPGGGVAEKEDESVAVAGQFHGVRVSGAGDKVLVVSVACRHRRDAVAKVCRALDGLRLRVIAANVTSASGTVTHTALVQREELQQYEMKELVEIAIAQLDDVIGSPLSTMNY
ncbi:hypothetical protein PR202_gb08467 [Eleusine coracana subsp. coracana]|uniref:Plant bHLH transcription factor ACT-like domain-containing protein n=1 Tax=Eleusine coracana subsp. coracana TaxID=191504 RepID=A0AAV5EEN7_ELECO|nr:hypothetical protein PR202_gb08467 [Eleusine coracana subsp. coracana]